MIVKSHPLHNEWKKNKDCFVSASCCLIKTLLYVACSFGLVYLIAALPTYVLPAYTSVYHDLSVESTPLMQVVQASTRNTPVNQRMGRLWLW